MTTADAVPVGGEFLDMQAAVGISKHTGGMEATEELLKLCHVETAQEVLNVGCGIGVASAHIARKYGCHVVGVDMSDKMIAWSQRRAREAGVETLVECRVANVLDLPFAADRFDVVFCESVLIFVEDKARAIGECVRVAKPGGYVGLSEAFWTQLPPPELLAQVKTAIGPATPPFTAWQALWEASGLQERVIRTYQTDPRTEMSDRIHWIGWRWLVRAWGRALRLYVTNPAGRKAIKETFEVPPGIMQYLGYGLFAGRK